MKKIYLILAVIGFILPNVFVIQESIDSGNIMLYTDIPATFGAMFVNNITSAFVSDLLFVVAVFFIWSYKEAKKYQLKRLPLVWLLTMLLGLAGGFPLFLYWREG